MFCWSPQPPSMAYGYASPASPWWPYAKYPELHRGRVGAWCPSLGNTADIVHDFTGNRNTGTMQPTFATGPTWVNSNGRPAWSFDGSNDYVDAGASYGFTSNNIFTISVWINIRGNGSDGEGGTILGRYAAGNGYLLYHYNTSKGLYWQGNGTGFISNYRLPIDIWHHVCFRRDATNETIYANGVEILTKANVTLTAASQNLVIGTYTIPSVQLFNGRIDDVQIYNRAISANEIKLLYKLGRGGSYAIDEELVLAEIAAGGPFPHFIRRSQVMSGGFAAC